MIKKKVPLDNIEKKLIEVAYASNEKELNKKFDWKSFFILIIINVFSFVALLVYESFGIPWLFSILILATIGVLYVMVTNYLKDKKEAILQKEKLSRLKNLEEIEIYECCCDKALYLFDDHFEGNFICLKWRKINALLSGIIIMK
jgi:hypothetical protein